jgi:hypothetical protein
MLIQELMMSCSSQVEMRCTAHAGVEDPQSSLRDHQPTIVDHRQLVKVDAWCWVVILRKVPVTAKRLPAVVDCLTALGAYPFPQLQEVASELAATSTLIEPHDELLTSLLVA